MRHQHGFSLIELIVSTGILLLLMGGVFSQVAKMQSFSRNEEKKRDMFQNVREVLDQMNRDIHAAGYPNATQFNLTGSPVGSNSIGGFTSQTAVNSSQVERERTEQRLRTDEANRNWYTTKRIYPPGVCIALNGDTEPDVSRPGPNAVKDLREERGIHQA